MKIVPDPEADVRVFKLTNNIYQFLFPSFFSNVHCKADARLYDVLQVEISSWPSWIQQIVNFVTTITFIFPILTVVWLVYSATFSVLLENMVNS